MNIKGIIFDYGGTLDSRGVHWSEVLWQGYQQARVPIDKDTFRNAYVEGERALAIERESFSLRTIFTPFCVKKSNLKSVS